MNEASVWITEGFLLWTGVQICIRHSSMTADSMPAKIWIAKCLIKVLCPFSHRIHFLKYEIWNTKYQAITQCTKSAQFIGNKPARCHRQNSIFRKKNPVVVSFKKRQPVVLKYLHFLFTTFSYNCTLQLCLHYSHVRPSKC